MNNTPTPSTAAAPFEGSAAAQDFITRLDQFFRDELMPLAAEHLVDHEHGADRALLEKVWNIDAEITTRTVDTHVKRLREKLGSSGDYIETVRGVGYRFLGDE